MSMKKYKRPLLFILNSFKWHKKLFYVFFLWKIIEWLFYVILPVVIKLEMDQLVEKNEQLFWIIELSSFNIFLVILTIIFWIKLLENLLKSFIELFEWDYVKIYENYFWESLYERIKNIEPWVFLNSRNKRFIEDVIWISNSLWYTIRSFLWKIISNFFVIIWIITVLALINVWVFFIIVLSGILLYFIDKLKNKYQSRHNFEEKYDLDEKMWILTHQMKKNMNYLISSWWYDFVLGFFAKHNKQIKDKTLLMQKKNLVLSIFSFIIENISEMWVKLVIGYWIFFWTTSIWTMTMSILYIWRLEEFFTFVRSFKWELDEFKDNLLKLDLFLDLVDTSSIKKINELDFSSIKFISVDFKYPNFAETELKYLEITENRIKKYSNNWEYEKDELHLIEESRKELKKINPIILNKINLNFESWKTYWLVWKNWAWKTTITSLLMNFFSNYTWNILINSDEAKLISRESFVSNISVINQIPYIISGFSVRENLMLWVNKYYKDERIIELLEKFNLKDKIFKSRKGLDSRIWYDNDFSWWEKQLIVLIRTILQDKKVLIMDEGTNQLDAENEILIMNELLKNKKDKIVIFITHRMTTIKKADVIYCLDKWKIEFSWSHKELMSSNNVYSDLYNKQLGD